MGTKPYPEMDYYNDTTPLEFISDIYAIMKDGDCLSPEKMIADVVDMLNKYLSAKSSEKKAFANKILDGLSEQYDISYTKAERDFNVKYLVALIDTAEQDLQTE